MPNTPLSIAHPTGDLIDNPFTSLKKVNPVLWPDDIFERISPNLQRKWKVPSGVIPESTEDLSYYMQGVYDLVAELDESRSDINFLHERTPNLLSRLLKWLTVAKGIDEEIVEVFRRS
ncbi:hypothetical protein Hypma_004393 [Hypsizygus marmoreus]|uniref:Uncharacterized protein n=1 Tax=Hypsizygus marmoreus TaxID=39966 RepID=A0A369K3G5_HYPMA|nr:hypothetical protein Hypma_004393 [Hypsizygus marmoreus]